MTGPVPPVAQQALPWDQPVDDVVASLDAARRQCGDTFFVVSGGVRHLFLFSPTGVRSFYALPEQVASKGVADWQMLLRKLPAELFDGRRTLPHDLFGRDDVTIYLDNLDLAIAEEWEVLGPAGEVDVFALTRRLGHRMGLASWAGPESARGTRFDRLMAALDQLDGSAAFVHPEAMASVAANDHADERAAMAEAEACITETLEDRRTRPADPTDLLDQIMARWDVESDAERRRGIAHDVILVHLGSMSNLFAALGWTIVHLLEHDDIRARVLNGEDGLLEHCALESTRLAQRSIMLRAVLAPTEIDDGASSVAVEQGDVVATFLPLTNTSSLPGLDGYDPDRWGRRRLRDEDQLVARELVTTFGHGKHTCPAMSFSLAAMSRSVQRLLDDFELTPGFTDPRPLPSQIGGVARAADPCTVVYRRRDG